MLTLRSCFGHACVFVAGLLAIAPAAAAQLPKRLIADYSGATRQYDATKIPYSRLTHIIHDGIDLSPRADGSVVVPSWFPEAQLVPRAHAAGVKVLAILDGSVPLYARVAANPAARANLGRSLAAFLKRYDYDGIDFDWEYPVFGADRANYPKMLAAVRASVPEPKLLSLDVPSDPRPLGNGYDVPSLLHWLDFMNVMAYDNAGPWAGDAQLNSPIFTDPLDPDGLPSVESSIDLLVGQYGADPAKLNMGTPFYGYLYTNVENLYDPCDPCDAKTVRHVPYGTFVKPLVDAHGWHRTFDTAGRVPYLRYGSDSQDGFITYDDPRSTYERTRYSLWNRGLGGAFMWTIADDYDGASQDLFRAMYGAVTSRAPLLGP